MFGMFKSIIMAQFKPGDSRVIQVEQAIGALESTVAEVTRDVHSGGTFVKKNSAAPNSDDDFTSPPSRKQNRATQNHIPRKGAQVNSTQFETPIGTDGRGEGVEGTAPVDTAASTSVSGDRELYTPVLGSGNSHKGGSNKSYSMYIRFLAMADWFAGLSQDEICRKYNITAPRSLRRWLQEWGRGQYDECM